MLIVNSQIRIPRSEFELSYVRSSGPGGQNVNKVASKAVLRWAVLNSPSLPADVRERFVQKYGNRLTGHGDLVVTSQRYRDQSRNASDAIEKVGAMLAAVARPQKKRRPTKPSRAAVAKRIENKQARSRTKKMRRRPEED